MKKYRFNFKKFITNQVKLWGIVLTVVMWFVLIAGICGIDILPTIYKW